MDGDAVLPLLVDHPEPWTAADLDRFPEGEGWKVEIIDGTLIVERNPETWAPWTPGDLDRFPESNRYEIIDGLLFVNAQPVPLHQVVADNLRDVVNSSIDRSLVVVRDIGVSLADSVVGPDLTVLRRDEVHWTENEQAASATVLVIEVASPTTRTKDRTLKAEKYAEAGIPGYWRVELDPITVIAYVLRDGGYVELGSWSEGQLVEVDEPVRIRFDPVTLRP